MISLYSLVVAGLLLALVLFFNRRKSATRANALLLVGAPDAGKTAILTTLLYKRTQPTLTSLQTNTSVIFSPRSKEKVKVIDVPGHPRMRDQFRDHLSETKVIAFVVDASTISRNAAAVAEHLHLILHGIASLPPSRAPPRLIILAHKVDIFNSTTSSSPASSDSLAVMRVRTILERELEKRRTSQLGGIAVEGLGNEGDRLNVGGLECNSPAGSAFKFSEWEGGEVEFIASSLSASEKGGVGLSDFLELLEDH